MNLKIVFKMIFTSALAASACGIACTPPTQAPDFILVREDPTDLAVAGITDRERARFDRGDAAFEAPARASQGLGPLYIRTSCASCHADDAKGPGFVNKMVIVEDDGFTTAADQSALPFGHTVRPFLASGASEGIVIPEGVAGLKVSTRIGPAVFGRGFLEAIDDAEIERVEAEQGARGDDVTGRIHRVAYQSEVNETTPFHQHQPGDEGLIGRFGLKARIATLDEFTADAFQGDMGMTTPQRPVELPNPEGLTDDNSAGVDVEEKVVNDIADYMRMLAIPLRATDESEEGRSLFESTGCAACHVPSLRTRQDYPIPVLADIDAPIFSDLMLHDMGVELADGLPDNDASGREWKTAPLIGMRHLRSFLHDGRAATIDGAIRLHGGEGSEAATSAASYAALDDGERDALLAFVEAL